jgi:hypothetical protein
MTRSNESGRFAPARSNLFPLASQSAVDTLRIHTLVLILLLRSLAVQLVPCEILALDEAFFLGPPGAEMYPELLYKSACILVHPVPVSSLCDTLPLGDTRCMLQAAVRAKHHSKTDKQPVEAKHDIPTFAHRATSTPCTFPSSVSPPFCTTRAPS